MAITITEVLAEIKTIGKRVAKRREGLMQYLGRQDGVRDPLEKDGGSTEFIKRERQAVADMDKRLIALRLGIAAANDATKVTIKGVTRTISEWLTWRRDVAPGEQAFLGALRRQLQALRENAKRQGVAVVQAVATTGDTKPSDIVINIDEAALAAEIDTLEEILGELDGQLSLKNATVAIKE